MRHTWWFYSKFLFSIAVVSVGIYAATFKAKLGVVKRIAIVGSGPAGLGLAASIKQLNTGIKEVCLFDSRDDFLQTNLGGGVQLSGGAAVLEK
jgi:NADPH-dependent 2,4-dienoyl-CoA reductase/sulfur reductase-like enzyme